MNCDQFRDWMHDRLDEALSAGDSQRLGEHVQSCGSCRAVWDQLTYVHRGLDELRSSSDLPVDDRPGGAEVSRSRFVGNGSRVAAMLVFVAGAVLVGRVMLSDRPDPIDPVRSTTEAAAVAYEPTVRLVDSSADRYMAVPAETSDPDVHIVWLHHLLPSSEENVDPGPSSAGPSAPCPIAAAANGGHKPVT